MPVTMNHTGFVVSDLARSLAFYCDGLSLSFQVEASSPALSQLLGYDDARVRAAWVKGSTATRWS